jgi:hypothetical protein
MNFKVYVILNNTLIAMMVIEICKQTWSREAKAVASETQSRSIRQKIWLQYGGLKISRIMTI